MVHSYNGNVLSKKKKKQLTLNKMDELHKCIKRKKLDTKKYILCDTYICDTYKLDQWLLLKGTTEGRAMGSVLGW